MATTPRVSIVIRAYNEEQHLGQLLSGIKQQSITDVEIILVDSGSTDQTVGIAESFGAKIVRIDPHDFTFGRSLNMGIAVSNSDLVVLASAHVFPVYPDWLEQLIKPFENPRVAVTYGKQRGTNTSKFSEHRIFSLWFPDTPNPIQDHPFCNNANAAIRRSFWKTFPYDENLPGLEDLEWANRMMLHGYLVQYVPAAEIIHVHNETPAGIFRRYQREAMAFKRIFPTEKFGFYDFLRLTESNIRHDMQAAIQTHRFLGSWKSIIWFRFMQFWGTYQGYRQSGPLTWQLRERFYYPYHQNPLTQERDRSVKPIEYN